MSAANGSAAPDITLDELDQLIKFLGLLGSAHDGEVVAAARFATKWLAKFGTDWRTLLTPADEVGVTGVVAVGQDADEADPLREAAYGQGYAEGIKAGMAQMAAQVRAQAAMVQGFSHYAGQANQQNPFAAGLGAGLGGAGLANAANQGLSPGAAQTPSQGPRVATPGAMRWQDVAQELLDRHDSGIPGVFRSSREESFVRDVLGRGFATLTSAQDTWLRDIAGRSGLRW